MDPKEIINLISLVEAGAQLFTNIAFSVKNVINSSSLLEEDVITLNIRIDAAIAKLPVPEI